MYPREEQYPVRQRVNQGQPQPSTALQVAAVFAFLGFLIGLPTIIDRLGK